MALKGQHLSEETKRKLSISKKGKFIGAENPNWKGGVVLDRGRKLIYSPSHPRPSMFGTHVYEYVLIVEKHIGRYLVNGEVVHHIDGNVENNLLENLQLTTQSEHIKLHKKDLQNKKWKENHTRILSRGRNLKGQFIGVD